jgi:adenylosuccinate synthase
LRKGDKAIGTTLQGIGPSYASKVLRFGLRVGDLIDWDTFLGKYNTFIEAAKFQLHVPEFDTAKELDALKQLRERMIKGNMIVDSIDFMNQAVQDPKQRIIAEGANACMLDIDYGTFPFVTSSSTTIGGVCTGLGVPPGEI